MEPERDAQRRAEIDHVLDELDDLLARREDDAVEHDMVDEWTAVQTKTEQVRATLAAGDVAAAHRAAKAAERKGRALELALHERTDRTAAGGATGIGRILGDLADVFRIFG